MATYQQVRAYKRQVDGLREELTKIEEKNKQLQNTQDGKSGFETQLSELESQIHLHKENELKMASLLHEKLIRESELQDELDTTSKTLRDQLNSEKAQHERTVTNMRNANMVLQQKLRDAWDKLERHQVADQDHPSWLIQMDEIIITDKELGSGSYGDVREAMFRGTKVAVKRMHKIILSSYNKQKFIKEMNISASCHHPNIVQFIGAPITNVEYPILLYELMEISLYGLLHKGRPLDRLQIINISCDISLALSYLHHSRPAAIIHRDVSSSNILMESLSNGQWRGKLCDFGSAKLQSHHTKTEAPGNPYYGAYEAQFPDHHSPSMDIYSFAIVLMEMSLNCPPEGEGKARERQAHTIAWIGMKQLVLQCIAEDRLQRPGITQVLQTLQRLL